MTFQSADESRLWRDVALACCIADNSEKVADRIVLAYRDRGAIDVTPPPKESSPKAKVDPPKDCHFSVG